MKRRIPDIRCLFLVLVVALLSSVTTHSAETASTAVGQELHVFPGDKFYAEGDLEKVPILLLEKPFEGRMPGSMRIPFSFAIDSLTLRFSGRRGDWDYYAAPSGRARAWHSAIGNVLGEGDSVGVRIHRSKGTREWYVDNTNYNRATGWPFVTIWNRRIDPEKDVEVREGGVQSVRVEGSRVRGLEYLGVRDNQLRIRYEEFGPQDRTEEFLFPITGEEPLYIGVKGLRAEVRQINGASARIKVLRGFQSDDFATPAD